MAVKVLSYNLDAISYIPLYPVESLSYRVEVMNASSGQMNFRTNPSDPNTQISILPGESKVFESIRNGVPYNAGTPLIYGIMSAGTGTVKLVAH